MASERRSLKDGNSEAHIKVALRVRPLLRRELEQAAFCVVSVSDNVVTLENVRVRNSLVNQLVPSQDDANVTIGDSRERIHTFAYDFVYPGDDQSSLRYVHQAQVSLLLTIQYYIYSNLLFKRRSIFELQIESF